MQRGRQGSKHEHASFGIREYRRNQARRRRFLPTAVDPCRLIGRFRDETLMLGVINALSGKMRPCVTIRRYLERCGQR
jgi:hypothetical protein